MKKFLVYFSIVTSILFLNSCSSEKEEKIKFFKEQLNIYEENFQTIFWVNINNSDLINNSWTSKFYYSFKKEIEDKSLFEVCEDKRYIWVLKYFFLEWDITMTKYDTQSKNCLFRIITRYSDEIKYDSFDKEKFNSFFFENVTRNNITNAFDDLLNKSNNIKEKIKSLQNDIEIEKKMEK